MTGGQSRDRDQTQCETCSAREGVCELISKRVVAAQVAAHVRAIDALRAAATN